jgi:succinyl-diaminopimelate desuccinylase
LTQSKEEQKNLSALERLLMGLLAIPSVIENEEDLRVFCEEYLGRVGVEEVVVAGNNLAFRPRTWTKKKPKLLLLGHLDTVPSQGENRPRMEGDRIFGLGASDMKGGDALILELCKRAVREEPAVDLACVLYAREEGPFLESGMPEIVEAAPSYFSDLDLAIAMEPTNGQLELGCLGTMHATVRIHGRAAHSARPWLGHNAIHAAGPLLEALQLLAPREIEFHGLQFREVLSATMISFAGARNVIPPSCELNLNFRFGPDRSIEDAKDFLKTFVRDKLPGERVDLEFQDVCPSGRVCGDNTLLSQLEAVADSGLSRKAKQAWTDVGRLSAMGIDAINLGPGDTSEAHQKNESCSRSILRQSRSLFHRFLFGSEAGD